MTQYAIPGYPPLTSKVADSTIRVRYYEPVVIEVPADMTVWRILAYVGFDSPKLWVSGSVGDAEYDAGPPATVTLDFDTEDAPVGSLKFEGFDVSGALVIERWIEVSD